MWYRIKQKANIVESQACCEEKQETIVQAMTTSGFFIWLGINWEVIDWKYDCKARQVYEHISYLSHWSCWELEIWNIT